MKGKIGIKDIIIIVLLLIIIGGCIFIVKKDNDNKKEIEEVVEKPKEEDKLEYYDKDLESFKDVLNEKDIIGSDIEDSNIVNDLKSKANIVISGGQKDLSDSENMFSQLSVWTDFTNLSDGDKMSIILYRNFDKFHEITDESYKSKVKPEYDMTKDARLSEEEYLCESGDSCMMNYIDYSEVKDDYLKIFGDVKTKKINEVVSCPVFLYLKTTDSFISYGGCGGAGYPGIYTYIYKVTSDEDKAYVYVASLTGDVEGKVYSGIPTQAKNVDKLFKVKETSENVDLLKLLKSYYKKFDNYRLEFKKDSNGNYIFVDAKLIAEQKEN